MSAPVNLSPAVELIDAIIEGAPDIEAVVAAALAELSVVELAALAYDWGLFWARAKQLPPPGNWRSWGFLASRRLGKTRALAEFVNGEAASGRAMRQALIAQTEDLALEVMVHGDSGILACSPPWFRPIVEGLKVTWPNGAEALIFTPERPGKIRGPGVHLAWASELQSWPTSKRREAFSNLTIMTSLGYARLVWDATSCDGHPILGELLERSEADPTQHYVVRGRIEENAINLGDGVVEALRKLYDGTATGRQELDGEYNRTVGGAKWLAEWIDAARRDLPDRLARRVLSIDPAISEREGTDDTGFADLGSIASGQLFVIENLTKKWGWDDWGVAAVNRYFAKRCDCIVLEINRGGAGCAANIRAAAKSEGYRVEVVKLEEPVHHVPGVIFVKEVNSQESKGARADSAVTLYRAGRVSHVRDGAGLDELEHRMCTHVFDPDHPGRNSPNEIDAVVHGVWELAGLWGTGLDLGVGFAGIEKMAEALRSSPSGGKLVVPSVSEIAAALGRAEWRSKI